MIVARKKFYIVKHKAMNKGKEIGMIPLEALLEEVTQLRELEKTYLKVIKALHLECTRLEEEVSQLRRLKEEVKYLQQLELWYIKALKGLNEECNRLEREIYELKRRSVLPQTSVNIERYLEGDFTLLELLAFADSRVSLKALKKASSWLGVEYRRAKEEIKKLERDGIIYLKNGHAVIRSEVQEQFRDYLLRSIPDRDEIIENLNADAIEAVELLRRRRGVLTKDKFEELDVDKKAALLKLVEKKLLFRTIDRDGELIYFMPEEVLELMEELRVEVAKRSKVTREELMKKLNIKDPTEEEIDLILSTFNESELEPAELESNETLIEAFRNEQVDVLVNALKSEDVHIRRFAVSALWKIGSRDVVEHLIEMLDDTDAYVRRLAISALLKIPDERMVEPMIRKLDDEDSMVRYSAASYFDNYPHSSAFPSLVKALRDEDSMVRTVAASALGKLGMKEAVPYLIEALRDEDAWVRHCAAEALDKIKGRIKNVRLA